MVQRFPTPRLQTDDGNEEIAEMHAREDLLLDHYSWVDRSSGKVRIPDCPRDAVDGPARPPGSRSEEPTEPLMAGDKAPVVTYAAHRWLRPDRLRAAIPGDRRAAADAGGEAGRAGGSGSESLVNFLT